MAQTLLRSLSRTDSGFDVFGDKNDEEVGEDKASGGGSVRGFTDEIKNASKNSKKINIKLNSCTKLKNAFDVQVEARSKNNSISSTSSNDEGISKTPKNLTKKFQNFQNSKNQDRSYNELNSVSSVESAFTNQINIDSSSEFSATSFQKRLFGKINKKYPAKAVSFHKYWASIRINDFMFVEMTPFSLQNGGRDAFNDFLDDCYDDDSVCKLVVYFDETNKEFDTMKTTFSTMDFHQMTTNMLTKTLGEKLTEENFYMVMNCAITTSDEDFSEDELEDGPDLIVLD